LETGAGLPFLEAPQGTDGGLVRLVWRFPNTRGVDRRTSFWSRGAHRLLFLAQRPRASGFDSVKRFAIEDGERRTTPLTAFALQRSLHNTALAGHLVLGVVLDAQNFDRH
jgi:hypothetical protein